MIAPPWNLDPALWTSLALTLRLATVSTLLLMGAVLPLGWWLASTRSRPALVVEVLVSMPLVLPPTVIGFYLLVLLSPRHAFGQWWQHVAGQALPFSFAGLVIGSCVYSLPFALQPVLSAFRMQRHDTLLAARSLGMTAFQTFLHVRLPLARAGIGSGLVLAFAHTIGEFGVVLMLGGNIPGVTRVASIALYDEVQKFDYAQANGFALVLVALSFAMLCVTTLLQRRQERWRGHGGRHG